MAVISSADPLLLERVKALRADPSVESILVSVPPQGKTPNTTAIFDAGADGIIPSDRPDPTKVAAFRKDLRARKMLSELHNSFLQCVAHELRTPLNPIVGLSNILLEDESDPSKRDLLTSICDAGHSLVEQINSVLAYIEMTSSETFACEEPFQVTQLFESVKRRLSATFPNVNVTCRFSSGAGISQAATLLGDYQKIANTLYHLTTNAVKFSRQQPVEIVAELEHPENRQWELRLTVQDQGIGLAKADFERIFEPFMQLDASMTRSFDGLGLGLAIVAEYVKVLRGEITLESRVGLGTTVRFSVPIQVSDEFEKILL